MFTVQYNKSIRKQDKIDKVKKRIRSNNFAEKIIFIQANITKQA